MSGSRKIEQSAGTAFRLFFWAVLVLLGLSYLLRPVQAYSAREKRTLSGFPALTAESLLSGRYMDELETALADQFPLRDKLIEEKSAVCLGLGMKESEDVYRLKNGMLAEEFTAPAAEAENELTEKLLAFGQLAQENGTTARFMLVPTAVSVYSDQLPAFAASGEQDAYIDRLFQSLSGVYETVDVRECFAAVRDTEKLYYNSDHHWRDAGVRLGASQLLEAMDIGESVCLSGGVVCNDFSGSLTAKSGFTTAPDSIVIYPLEQGEGGLYYTVTYDSEQRLSACCYDYEALQGDDPYQIFFGGNAPSLTIETSSDSGRRLLLIKDSYANALLPLLIPYFQKIKVIDPRYYYEDLGLELASGRYSDVLVLYNASTLAADRSLVTVLREGLQPTD